VEWLEKALAVDPGAMRPHQLLTSFYIAKRRPRQALDIARRALERYPNSPSALELVGVAQLAVGETQSAIVTLERLATIAPQAATPHYLLGLAYQANRDLEKAKKSLAKASEISPDYVPTKEHLMLLEVATGEKDKALSIARKMQEDDPGSALGYRREGDIHFASRDFGTAAQAYAKAASIGPDSQLMMRWHQAEALAGNRLVGNERLVEWLADHPDDNLVRQHLAAAYLQEGRDDAAVAEYQSLLAQQPKNVLGCTKKWVMIEP
jgi:tetratricopeptide (TPR) repeat protein